MNATKKEKAAREAVEKSMKRDDVELNIPKSVSGDQEALEAWNRIVADLKEVELMDNLDSDMLGVYCVGVARLERMQARYTELAGRGLSSKMVDDALKAVHAQEKMQLAYAEKLGLTPTARARLAVKKAKQEEIDADETELFGGM